MPEVFVVSGQFFSNRAGGQVSVGPLLMMSPSALGSHAVVGT